MKSYTYLLNHGSLLTILFRLGFVSSKLNNSLKMYKYYTDSRNLKISKTKSIKSTSEYFKVSIQTVYTTIKSMESKI